MQFSTALLWICALILTTSPRVTVAEGHADSLVLQRSHALEGPVRYFNVDHLGNYYLITRANELVKYDAKGAWVANHRQQLLGPLEMADVSNPMQLLLFYPELSTLLQLDNMLYATNRFQLSDVNQGSRSLLCRSFDNNFWLYDERAFRLRKLALDMRTVVQGEWLQNHFDMPLKPAYLLEYNELLYLADPGQGILVFDLYGRYQRLLPIKGVERFDVHGAYLYWVKGGEVYRYHLQSLTEERCSYPGAAGVRQIRVNSQGHYLLTRNALLHYSASEAVNR